MIMMADIWPSALLFFLIIDPLGNIPIFISVLKNVAPHRRKRVLIRELLIALLFIYVFLFAGQNILDVLGLEQSSVRVAGGLILFLIAIKMIFPTENDSAKKDMEEKHYTTEEPFIVPLAVPLVSGPSLMAAIILTYKHDITDYIEGSIALFIAWFASFMILMCSDVAIRILGKSGLIALERLMGMILVMIAVQMFLNGVISYLP